MTNMQSVIARARQQFHQTLLDDMLTLNDKGIPSNADSSSKPSIDMATGVLQRLGSVRTADRLPGQTAGANFEFACATFLDLCFSHLRHLRPGQFGIEKGQNIARFDQYAHLDELEMLSKQHKPLSTALGSDYLIKPDIVLFRSPENDAAINSSMSIVDAEVARLSPLRKLNSESDILHASVSCKWTIRSDRAQNSRAEALNLVRNRKGKLPHICVVTAEPTPNRIASLALGTGDIDCVYHFALYELRDTLVETQREDALELLDLMIDGKRLRDISDLPLDLVV